MRVWSQKVLLVRRILLPSIARRLVFAIVFNQFSRALAYVNHAYSLIIASRNIVRTIISRIPICHCNLKEYSSHRKPHSRWLIRQGLRGKTHNAAGGRLERNRLPRGQLTSVPQPTKSPRVSKICTKPEW